jgi:hypothetical protein
MADTISTVKLREERCTFWLLFSGSRALEATSDQ